MGRDECFDVVVAGGGTAGIAAAIAAAEGGARTLLVEASGALGGSATHAFVHTICGLYLSADGDRPVYAHPGFPRRFATGLAAAGGAAAPERAGRVFVLPTFPPVLARHAATLVAATPALVCWTEAPVVAVVLGAPTLLRVARAEGAVDVEARIVIDATGDGALGALGGAEVTMADPETLQCPSFVFRLGGVAEGVAVGFGRLQLTVAAAGAVRDGELPPGCESLLVRPGAAPDEVYVTLNVPKPDDRPFAPLDDAARRALAEVARARAVTIVAFLRATRPAFRNAVVRAWPDWLGVRETRRLGGCVVLAEADVLEGRRRDDEVAVSTWPIELWHDHRRAELRHPAGPSSIPLGALVSRSHPTLGMAGRCLSATHEALGALRVIGAALATGEAIGTAAALAADAGDTLADVAPARVRAAVAARAEVA